MSTYFLHKMNQYRSDGRKSMMFVPFLTDFVFSLFDFNNLPPHSPCEVCQRLRHRWCSWNRVDVPQGCLARPRTSRNGSCSQFFRWSRLLLGNRSSRCPQCGRSPLYRNAGRGRGLVHIPIRLRLTNYSLERCLFPDNRWNIEVTWRRSHPAHLRSQGCGVDFVDREILIGSNVTRSFDVFVTLAAPDLDVRVHVGQSDRHDVVVGQLERRHCRRHAVLLLPVCHVEVNIILGVGDSFALWVLWTNDWLIIALCPLMSALTWDTSR